MDVSISKTADGRHRKFIGGQWFPPNKDEKIAKLQTMALLTQWEQLKVTGIRAWPALVLANTMLFWIVSALGLRRKAESAGHFHQRCQ